MWNMGQRLAGGRRGRGAASARLAELLPGVDHGDPLHDRGMVRIQDVGPRGRVRVGEAGGGELVEEALRSFGIARGAERRPVGLGLLAAIDDVPQWLCE